MTASEIADPAPLPPARDNAGDPLEGLARLFASHHGKLPLVRYGGRVTEVAPSHVLVRGIERRVELGSSVEVEGAGQRWLGEVIGIEADCANIKLFSTSPRLGLGAPVWVRDSL